MLITISSMLLEFLEWTLGETEMLTVKRIIPAVAAAIFTLPAYAQMPLSGEIILGNYSHKPDGFSGDRDIGFGIRAALQANKNIAFEVGYQSFGEASYQDEYYTSSYSVRESLDVDIKAFTLGLKASTAVNPKLSLNGRIGFAFWDADLDANYEIDYSSLYVSDQNITESASEDGSDIYFGFGLDYQVASKVYLSASYMRLDADDYELSGLQAGVGMRF